MKYQLEFSRFSISGHSLNVEFSGYVEDEAILSGGYSRPKPVLYFDNGKENRRIPLVLQDIQYLGNRCVFSGKYRYQLNHVYWSTKGQSLNSILSIHFTYGSLYDERMAFSLSENAVECDEQNWVCTLKENCFELVPIPPKKANVFKRFVVQPLAWIFDQITLILGLCMIPWFCWNRCFAF